MSSCKTDMNHPSAFFQPGLRGVHGYSAREVSADMGPKYRCMPMSRIDTCTMQSMRVYPKLWFPRSLDLGMRWRVEWPEKRKLVA